MACSFFCPQDAIKIGFLEGWHVNGAYPLIKIEEGPTNKEPYITKDTKGFYKCFYQYFVNIDELYKKIFDQ